MLGVRGAFNRVIISLLQLTWNEQNLYARTMKSFTLEMVVGMSMAHITAIH